MAGVRDGVRFNYVKNGLKEYLVISREVHLAINAILKSKANDRTIIRQRAGGLFHCATHVKARTEDLREILLLHFNIVTDENTPVHLVKFEI